MITDELAELLEQALSAAIGAGFIEERPLPEIQFERPKRREHGDWATNVALVLAAGGDPRAVARALVDHLPPSPVVEKVEVAGPGFLNFHLAPRWLEDVVRRAADPSSGFGRSRVEESTRVNLEYVSANPTGPISVVGGRHAAVGDAIANLLEATGHEVTREFYVNDAGRQIRLFGQSVAAHYMQLHGVDVPVPEEGYKGDYVVDEARAIADDVGDRFANVDDARRAEALGEIAARAMAGKIKVTLERFGTTFDVWTFEHELHDSGAVKEGIARLDELGLIERRDGAVVFLSSRFGDDEDRVIVRSDGEPTYLAGDVAYLLHKFGRHFDHLIYLWGADHHGTIQRLLAAAQALGADRSKVEVQLVQIVTLSRGGNTVKASKRAGAIVTLEELLDEVDPDAARYTFLSRSMDAPLDFDIDLVAAQAPENPVYYVKYAHARIASIVRKAESEGIRTDPAGAPLERLRHGSEVDLMRKLASYEEVVPEAAALRAPHRIAHFSESLAAAFSAFYRDCRVVSEDDELTNARLALCLATKAVLADALELLGVSAPERM